MKGLNALILALQQRVQDSPILVETTVERLLLLCSFEDSVFLKGNVYPAVKYYVLAGKEEACVKDLSSLFFQLRQFKGIQIVVVIAFDFPLPNLSLVCTPLLDASCAGFIRMLVLSPERSPVRLLKQIDKNHVPAAEVKEKKKSTRKDKEEEENPFLVAINKPSKKTDLANNNNNNNNNNDNNNEENENEEIEDKMSVDPYRIISSLENQGFLLKGRDFFPLSVLAVIEPFIKMLGYGRYSFKTHPFCGFVACLICVDNTLVPLSNYLNLTKFYSSVVPLLPQLNAAPNDIGFMLARKLRSIFVDCMIKTKDGPVDVLSFVTDPEKVQDTETFLDKIVLVTIHNNMDMAAVDLVRRCHCSSVTTTSLTENKIAAQCTGCL